MGQDEIQGRAIILFSDVLDATVVILGTFGTDYEYEIEYVYDI